MQKATSPEIDKLIENDTFFSLLDHGLIRVIDYMGNDQSIVDAARISYGQGTTSKNDDKGLINYLMRHHHTTPFEMCEIKLYIKCPIFVARQWMRHRTASINEYSARYSEVKDEMYIPKEEHVKGQHSTNKQMSDNPVSNQVSDYFIGNLESSSKLQYNDYTDALDSGISRETARIGLPLNTYTEFVWKMDLHNLLHFLRLRIDSHAQYEIRVYADAIAGIVKSWCPLAYAAFEEYRLNSETFSAKEMAILQYHGFNIKTIIILEEQKKFGFSNGEWLEFMKKLELK